MTRLALASLLAVGSSGCLCGGTVCSGGTGDAGSAPRSAGEPCVTSSECATGLSCVLTDVGGECLASCADAGPCAAGLACVEGWCQPTCANCSKRFASTCLADAGVCRPVACHNGAGCPSGSSCAEPLWCCPVGTPCPSPLPGVCTL